MTYEEIAKLVNNFGWPVVIAAAVIWFLRTYGPRIAEAHLDFVQSTKKNTEELKEMQRASKDQTEKLTESVLASRKDAVHCRTTTTALLGLCDTFEHAAENHPKAEKIKQSLSSVRTTLLTNGGQSH